MDGDTLMGFRRSPLGKIAFKNATAYGLRLARMADGLISEAMVSRAVYAGSKIVADEIRNNLEKLPTDEYRHLEDGEVFHGLPEGQKRDLAKSFGLTDMQIDKRGFYHTKAGFDGYGRFRTKAYPDGIPNPLLARAVESGSSVRDKTPFVEPAVKATRKAAVEAMEKVIDDELKKIF